MSDDSFRAEIGAVLAPTKRKAIDMTELAVVGADVAGGASPQPDHDIAATVAAIIRNAVVR